MEKEKKAEKMCEADWLYDNSKPMKVQIFKLNYDFFSDQDEGFHNEDETPELNENEEQYVLLNNESEFDFRNSSPWHTSTSLLEAKKYAEEILQQKLEWRYIK
ncbi:hypothetical protein [Kaistella pullorum]|uniref:Uncharacterized protein n=1 Tax=Kaistella pullorum TaxID=2763074 RepID=A0ABR8WQ10_9FLAO|nr:hypothetical protein [Kaistella pullorum]MBD8019150.1 hypothetical protein [Kaistella pullorum]